MPSVIQKKSYNSVKVFWLNKKLLQSNIIKAVNNLVHNQRVVKQVILFGSIAEDRGIPSSDVDILIIVSESQQKFLDRAVYFKKFFEDIGLGVDLFVYTEEEVKKNTIPLVNTAFKKGKILFKRESL